MYAFPLRRARVAGTAAAPAVPIAGDADDGGDDGLKLNSCRALCVFRYTRATLSSPYRSSCPASVRQTSVFPFWMLTNCPLCTDPSRDTIAWLCDKALLSSSCDGVPPVMSITAT